MLKPILSGATIAVVAIASGLGISAHARNFAPVTKTTQATPSTAPAQLVAQATTDTQTLEQSVLRQINQHRATKGLPALTSDSRIVQQARLHSQNMATGKVPFGHQGFDQRVREIGKSISYRAAAENVAYNMGFRDPATQAVQGWLKSPGHLRNIEGQYNLTGIGVSRNAKGEVYFTQIFIRR
jgi:uncharacterized protein YkwD